MQQVRALAGAVLLWVDVQNVSSLDIIRAFIARYFCLHIFRKERVFVQDDVWSDVDTVVFEGRKFDEGARCDHGERGI